MPPSATSNYPRGPWSPRCSAGLGAGTARPRSAPTAGRRGSGDERPGGDHGWPDDARDALPLPAPLGPVISTGTGARHLAGQAITRSVAASANTMLQVEGSSSPRRSALSAQAGRAAAGLAGRPGCAPGDPGAGCPRAWPGGRRRRQPDRPPPAGGSRGRSTTGRSGWRARVARNSAPRLGAGGVSGSSCPDDRSTAARPPGPAPPRSVRDGADLVQRQQHLEGGRHRRVVVDHEHRHAR